MPWADFRGKLLGPTDPASAPEGSLRQQIYSKWSDLGILEEYSNCQFWWSKGDDAAEAKVQRCMRTLKHRIQVVLQQELSFTAESYRVG